VKSFFVTFDENEKTKDNSYLEVEKDKVSETKRHHEAIEKIEFMKACVANLNAASIELDLQIKLHKQYELVKDQMSMAQIAQSFPQLIIFFNPDQLTDKQKNSYSEKYN